MSCARACTQDPCATHACGPPMWRVRPRAVGHLCDAACVGYCLGHLCSRLLGAALPRAPAQRAAGCGLPLCV
eukprot:9734984-Alexandrium_andersonii.AAC.1